MAVVDPPFPEAWWSRSCTSTKAVLVILLLQCWHSEMVRAPWRSRLGVPGSGLFACCCVRGPGLFPRLATRKLLECWMEHAGMIAGMIAGTIAECWHGLGCFRWHDRSWSLRLARLVGGNINRTRGPLSHWTAQRAQLPRPGVRCTSEQARPFAASQENNASGHSHTTPCSWLYGKI